MLATSYFSYSMDPETSSRSKNVEKMLMCGCGCEVRPHQIGRAHTCACASKSGSAMCVRATQKTVATHTLENWLIKHKWATLVNMQPEIYILSKFSIILPLRAIYFRSYQYETPCMTQLLSHTFAHLTGSSFRLKAKLLPIKNILGVKYN